MKGVMERSRIKTMLPPHMPVSMSFEIKNAKNLDHMKKNSSHFSSARAEVLFPRETNLDQFLEEKEHDLRAASAQN